MNNDKNLPSASFNKPKEMGSKVGNVDGSRSDTGVSNFNPAAARSRKSGSPATNVVAKQAVSKGPRDGDSSSQKPLGSEKAKSALRLTVTIPESPYTGTPLEVVPIIEKEIPARESSTQANPAEHEQESDMPPSPASSKVVSSPDDDEHAMEDVDLGPRPYTLPKDLPELLTSVEPIPEFEERQAERSRAPSVTYRQMSAAPPLTGNTIDTPFVTAESAIHGPVPTGDADTQIGYMEYNHGPMDDDDIATIHHLASKLAQRQPRTSSETTESLVGSDVSSIDKAILKHVKQLWPKQKVDNSNQGLLTAFDSRLTRMETKLVGQASYNKSMALLWPRIEACEGGITRLDESLLHLTQNFWTARESQSEKVAAYHTVSEKAAELVSKLEDKITKLPAPASHPATVTPTPTPAPTPDLETARKIAKIEQDLAAVTTTTRRLMTDTRTPAPVPAPAVQENNHPIDRRWPGPPAPHVPTIPPIIWLLLAFGMFVRAAAASTRLAEGSGPYINGGFRNDLYSVVMFQSWLEFLIFSLALFFLGVRQRYVW
ncbi:hypothetical protein B0T25DRAFT_570076 [Lasiosphaeria hispida]|uniref:Uncharacterized protein n=1 Tax=Lasiosphaeria hispida TaxID=260671 RepID=A0AAJ0HF10_9PEZI|nr:hypothetical protein B0T25DRAFT_570076 [Lasiosphaeria hispida]